MNTSYRKHLIRVTDGSEYNHDCNFHVICSCGYISHVATLSDEFAVRCAVQHIATANSEDEMEFSDED